MIGRHLSSCACVLATWFGSPSFSSGAAQPPSFPAEVALNPEAVRGGNLYLTLRLEGGEELLFMVDTGMPQTVLDKSLEPKLGKCLGTKTLRYALYGKSITRTYEAPRLYVGKAQLLTGRRVFTDNLRERKIIGPAAAGILGMDCLQHCCMQLDFDAMRIRFLDPDHPGEGDLGKAFRVRIFFNSPFTRANLSGVSSRWFLIDSGFIGGGDFVLRKRAFQRQLNKQAPLFFSESKTSAGGPGKVALFSQASFGGATYTNMALAQDGRLSWWDGNLLCLGFLSRNLVTFNFPKRVMYLKPTTVPLFAQAHSITLSARDFILSLRNKGQLPGWSKGDTGQATLPDAITFDGKYPISRTFDVLKNGDACSFHYLVVQSSQDGVWKLQRAWRTDASGSILEVYPVPSPP